MTDTYTPVLTDEQIDDAQESAYRALVAKGYNGGMGGFQWDRASARAIERAAIKAWQKQHPTIPDGWALVPVEPTEAMIVHGFESGPDEFFSPADEWEAFQEMSGCRQAAHKAKLCWAAMVNAAPTPPETQP